MNDVTMYTKEDYDFYPTPPELVEKMADSVDWHKVETVLEPSAGKGNIVYGILKHLHSGQYSKYSNFETIQIDCVEKDENLQSILKSSFSTGKVKSWDEQRAMPEDERMDYEIRHQKNVKLVGSDFLSFDTYKSYNLIIMNPPFSDGELHLLKAIQMQEENGGQIVCLLNAETIRNPYSNSRKLLSTKLQKYGAEIEFINGAFSLAERKSDVDVAMIKINIPEAKQKSIFIESLKKAEEVKDEDVEPSAVAYSNDIQRLVQMYKHEVESSVKLIHEYQAMCPYMLNRLPKSEDDKDMKYAEPILQLSVRGSSLYSSLNFKINDYIKAVRTKYWSYFLHSDKLMGVLTSNLQKELQQKVEKMADYDFTEFNIMQLREEVNASLSKGVGDTVLNLFDELSEKYSYYYDECVNNIHYYNGWMSNKAHMINKKVIIPMNGCFAYDWYSKKPGQLDLNVIYSKLSDIEKALNYLDNGETGEVNLKNVLEAAKVKDVSRKIPCKYFNVTFYKKGTCHIEFTNERLLEKLNIYGSQRKKWLPPHYGKMHYDDMPAEEKAVIDEFQGKEKYEEVMRQSDYYLISENSAGLLMLEQSA